MKALTKSEALERLARKITRIDERTEVYVLPSGPHGPSGDNDLHVAVLADVDDQRMVELSEAVAEVVQEVNVEMGFEPFVVAHPTNRNAMVARMARTEGVRL